MLRLFVKEIEDEYIQENFSTLNDFVNAEGILKPSFKFFNVPLSFPTYPHTVAFAHRLGYVPKDVIVTSKIGSGDYTIEHELSTAQNIFITITAPVTLRMFLGTYAETRTV